MGRRELNCIILLTVIFFFTYGFITYKNIYSYNSTYKNIQSVTQKQGAATITEVKEDVEVITNFDNSFKESFEVKDISAEVRNKIYGKSWKEGAPVEMSSLKQVIVSYWGFDEQQHIGELIVQEKVAKEVVDIFKELYNTKYPIDKIRLIDEYGASDEESMKDNNTSSFCYRDKTNTKELSKHSYGLAIDINPVQNPYIKGGKILPEKGKDFVDRTNIRKGMITKNDACYRAFKSRDWSWGGEWKNSKDYQHFEKNIKN